MDVQQAFLNTLPKGKKMVCSDVTAGDFCVYVKYKQVTHVFCFNPRDEYFIGLIVCLLVTMFYHVIVEHKCVS